jgi:hypothetical protein
MKTSPVGLFALGVALLVATPLVLVAVLSLMPAPPAAIPACGPEPPRSWVPIMTAAGQTRLVFVDYGGGARLSVWSNSTSDYSLFLLTESQYDSYGNTTGTNGTILFHPPSQFYWSSGTVKSTNNTFLFGSGNWYLMVYNPGSTTIVVNIPSELCNPP